MLRTATRRASLIATLAVLAACAASRGPATPSTVAPASDASPPVAEPARTDASVAALPAPATMAPPEPCMKLSLVPVCNPPSRTEGLSYEDTVAFFTKHGAKAPVNEAHTCDLLRLGPEREEALACTFFADRSEQRDVKGSPMIFRIQRREVVRVVRNKRIVTVLDVPLEYHVLDTPDFEPDPSFFGLAVDESDPSAIVVSEPRPGACAEAAAKLAGEPPKDRDEAAWQRIDTKLLRELCAATGRYVWTKGAFRKSGPSPGALPPTAPRPGGNATSL